jgi:integrase
MGKRAELDGLRNGIIRRGATYSYVVRVSDPSTGRSKPRWVGGFATATEAKSARDLARVSARRGAYLDRSSLTVGEYLNEWIAGHVEVKPKTRLEYGKIIRLYLIPRIGAIRLQGLRPTEVSRLYKDLLQSGGRGGAALSPRSVEYAHAVLHRALGDAMKEHRLIESNPATVAKRPWKAARRVSLGPRKSELTVFDPESLRRFLGAAAEHRLHAFFRLAAYTGARRGELLHLRWFNIDLTTGDIRLSGSVAVIGGERIEGTTKGDRERVVRVDDGTVAVLRDHRRRQVEERLAAGASWRDDVDLVFRRHDGGALFPDTVSQLMPQLCEAACVPRLRLHDLRHTHATTLLLAGVAPHVVADRLGHKDATVTLRIYAHVLRRHAIEVADVFARAVEGRS